MINQIGHNNPPEDQEDVVENRWRKSFFHMSIGEGELMVRLLEGYKKTIPDHYPKLHKIVDDRLKYLEKKMK